MPLSIREDELDVIGALFGLKYVGEVVLLFIQDDGWWYEKCSFHKNHLPDLKRVVLNANNQFK